MRITRIPMRRWIVRGLIVAILIAIVAAIVWAMMPTPVPVETARITRDALTVTVDADGRARVQDRYVVAAPLAGTMARIELHPGDGVVTGAVLARIAPLPPVLLDARTRAEIEGRVAIARARQKQAAAVIRRVESSVAFAKSELARIQRLAGQGAAPQIELDRATLEADLAARALDSARFDAAIAADELATAQAMLARAGKARPSSEEILVRAPVAGRVLRVFTESESPVAHGTPILEIGDPARLEIVVDVLTADAVDIRAGADVEIVGWGGRPLRGVVRRVDPSATTKISALGVEEQRVPVIIDLVDPPEDWQGLGDGWRVEARIVTWHGLGVVVVPLGALFREGERWGVFVVEGGRARRRLIELGARGSDAAEVRAGPQPGEVVILHPGERIDDGVKVAP